MKRVIISSDPGGARVLREMYPVVDDKNFWISYDKITMKELRKFDEIVIGTSTTMEIEKQIVSIAPETKITIVLDEIYNVKNRLHLLGSFLLSKVNHIIYIDGTQKSELVPGISCSFIQHPIFSKTDINFNYTYNPSGPLLLIDEFKENFQFAGSDVTQSGFLSNIIPQSNNLVFRSHPARRNQEIIDFNGSAVSGAIGYTTNYLIETFKNSIPTFTCSDKSVECLVNANLKRGRVPLIVGNFKFFQLTEITTIQ